MSEEFVGVRFSGLGDGCGFTVRSCGKAETETRAHARLTDAAGRTQHRDPESRPRPETREVGSKPRQPILGHAHIVLLPRSKIFPDTPCCAPRLPFTAGPLGPARRGAAANVRVARSKRFRPSPAYAACVWWSGCVRRIVQSQRRRLKTF